jgi:hypothetical protein
LGGSCSTLLSSSSVYPEEEKVKILVRIGRFGSHANENPTWQHNLSTRKISLQSRLQHDLNMRNTVREKRRRASNLPDPAPSQFYYQAHLLVIIHHELIS